MTREDIIRMARNEYGIYAFTAESLAEFATIIAAAERDRMREQFNIPKELAHEKTTGNEAD
jgi:hypothetical protein